MFLDPRAFPFTERLELNWREVRDEFSQVLPERLVAWPEKQLYDQGWSVFGLWAAGQRLEDNCRLCPKTAALVESIPGLTTAGFSLLAPGAQIRPHEGYTNAVLRCHLGVVVPAGCWLRVGDETKNWEEGKCLVFDDTVMHSAANESSRPRVILLVDFLRSGRQFDGQVSQEFVDLMEQLQPDKAAQPTTED